MKKVIMALCLLMFAGVAVNAQSCSKKSKKACKATCAKKKAMKTADAETKVLSAMADADVAAEADENIQIRECAVSGTKSYYEKSVCEKSGKVSWNQVEFDAENKVFTRVASASADSAMDAPIEEADATVKKCTKAEKKACAKSGKKCSKAKSCSKKSEVKKEEEGVEQ